MAAVFLVAPAMGCGDYASAPGAEASLSALTRDAISADPVAADRAHAALRAMGPAGLDALLGAHAAVLNAGDRSARTDWPRVRAAIEAVARQRDAHVSRLYWFTDFDAAKTAARASGRPILSLRLLGNLDDELSCANSRFFRTTLYANAEVSAYLRDHFVLHWKSVRPVPKITVDFGDGRAIERTITGNSIHYVLDVHGRPADALAGLYGAKAFLAGLARAEAMAKRAASLGDNDMFAVLRDFHRTRAAVVASEWERDLARLNPPVAPVDAVGFADSLSSLSLAGVTISPAQPARAVMPAATVAVSSAPSAYAAMPLAASKSGVETRLLRATLPALASSLEQSERHTDDETWVRIAALHLEDARVDTLTRQLIASKQPSAADAGRLSLSKSRAEDPLLRTIRNLERSIAEDTVRNEYLFHSRLHRWFADGSAPREVEALNRRVYAELFLTPDTDPWLGLVPPDTFAAIEGEGLKTANHR
jgi:hypothetical protein